MTPSIRADLTLGTAYGVAVSAVFWVFMLAPPRADLGDGLLIVAAAAAGAVATAFRGGGRLSPVYAVAVTTLLVSGPAVSCLAGAVAVLGGMIRDRRAGPRSVISQRGFRVAREALALALAAAGFVWAGGLAIAPRMLFTLSVHAAIYATVRALLAPLVRLATGGGTRLHTALHQTVAVLPGCAAGATLAWAAAETLAHPVSRVLLLAAGALTAAWAVHRMHADRRSVTRRHADDMIELRRGVTRALARTMEERDPRCQDHLRRVHRLCLGVAKSLGMSEVEMETLAAGALLHDIGKVSVPDSILSKPGHLTPQEMRQVERHPVTGAEIVQALPFRQSLAPVVRYHHERWDGKGYPDGLSREEIPLGARVLAAVDCYDALTTDRPYRRALPHREAAAYLSREAGTLFDPDVVDALLDCLEAREPTPSAEPLALDLGLPDETEATVEATATGSLTTAQRELETLYDISRATGYGLNLEEFLTLAACRLSTLVPYQCLVVYFLDEGSRMLRARFAMGRAADKLRVMTVPLGERLSGWAAVQQRAIIGRDHVTPLERDGARSDLEEWSDDPDVAGLKATLAAPMIAESGLVGVITLYDRIDRGFTAEERRLVVRVAGWAARVAAREEQATPAALTSLTDPLTGVPNARFLWLESAHRMAGDQAGFGLVAFRVGSLDQLGEENGNDAVDRTLCEVARRFASGCLRSETLVRFGQDLFIVLTPAHAAGELVGRWHDLAREVEQPLPGPGESVAQQVRLAAAHASYPDDGGNLDALLEALDQRLATAAHQGRTVIPFRAPGIRSESSG